MSTHVYLAQLKCPTGHCMMAAAGEFESVEAAMELTAVLMEKFDAMIAHGLNPVCAVCGSRELAPDLGRMPQQTMAEATPLLESKYREMHSQARRLLDRHSRN